MYTANYTAITAVDHEPLPHFPDLLHIISPGSSQPVFILVTLSLCFSLSLSFILFSQEQ